MSTGSLKDSTQMTELLERNPISHLRKIARKKLGNSTPIVIARPSSAFATKLRQASETGRSSGAYVIHDGRVRYITARTLNAWMPVKARRSIIKPTVVNVKQAEIAPPPRKKKAAKTTRTRFTAIRRK